jgi:hypothetical protein
MLHVAHFTPRHKENSLRCTSHATAAPPCDGDKRLGSVGISASLLSAALWLAQLRLPSVLLLDEPTSGLDATSSLKMVLYRVHCEYSRGTHGVLTG